MYAYICVREQTSESFPASGFSPAGTSLSCMSPARARVTTSKTTLLNARAGFISRNRIVRTSRTRCTRQSNYAHADIIRQPLFSLVIIMSAAVLSLYRKLLYYNDNLTSTTNITAPKL